MIRHGLFSIIMPAYNCKDTIGQSIESIMDQDYRSFELIVIDDCSTDNTWSIVSHYAKDSRLKLLRNDENLGVALTRNRGIKIAQGEFIAFCDSDDLWVRNKLSFQVRYLTNGYDIVCSNYIAFRHDELKGREVRAAEFVTYAQMLNSNVIPNSSAVYNAATLGKKYQHNVGHEDYAMWLRMVKSGAKAIRIQSPLMLYRIMDNSISSNKIKGVKWSYKILIEYGGVSKLQSIYHILMNILINLWKRRPHLLQSEILISTSERNGR